MVDVVAVIKICDLYDWDGKGEIDTFFLGDVMYDLGINTTEKECVGLGQTIEEGKKFATFTRLLRRSMLLGPTLPPNANTPTMFNFSRFMINKVMGP